MRRGICAPVGCRLILLCLLITCPGGIAQWASSDLYEALAHKNLEGVRAAVAGGQKMLGERAGEPEVADKFLPVPKDARIFSHAEAQRGFGMHFATLEKMRWWITGEDRRVLKNDRGIPAPCLAGGGSCFV